MKFLHRLNLKHKIRNFYRFKKSKIKTKKSLHKFNKDIKDDQFYSKSLIKFNETNKITNENENENSNMICSSLCLFIMLIFYYFSIIITKIKNELKKK
jgi:hypothetical protein